MRAVSNADRLGFGERLNALAAILLVAAGGSSRTGVLLALIKISVSFWREGVAEVDTPSQIEALSLPRSSPAYVSLRLAVIRGRDQSDRVCRKAQRRRLKNLA